MTLGDIASIATLILFFFYFLGRVWIINKEKILMRESFGVEKIESDEGFDEDRENYYDIDGSGEIISITSEVPILWLKVFPVQYDDDVVAITPRKGTPVAEHREPTRANCPIFLRTNIPEGIPLYQIRFLRFDYMIVSFNIGYNGRFGGMCPVDYRISHTIRSLLYYLLK